LTGEIIGKAVAKLWKELHGTDTERSSNHKLGNMKISHIAIAFTGIEPLAPGQRAIEGFFAKSARTPPNLETSKDPPNEENFQVIPDEETLQYVCPDCGKKIEYTVLSKDNDDLRATKRLAVKLEHEDFHFAQRLSREDKVVLGSGVGKRRRSPSPNRQDSKKGKEKNTKEKGIKSYFQKKWYVKFNLSVHI
jgi:DNA polymerase eta